MREIDRLIETIESFDNERHGLFDQCLLWDGTLNRWNKGRVRTGHGKWHVDPERKQLGSKWLTVSRFAYEYMYGPLDPGMQVLHVCDVPNCINPLHLFAGTQKDNMQDAASKGRLHLNKTGECHPAARLTDKQAEEIRNSNLSQQELAIVYGCSQSQISLIKSGKRSRHNIT